MYVYNTEPGGWAKVRYNNKVGYVSAGYLVPASSEISTFKKEAVATASPILHVRATPSPKAKVIGTLKKRAPVYVYATDTAGWSEIRYNGKKAYVGTSYLTFKSRLTLKEAEKLILSSEPAPDKEIKMSYYEAERDVYRAKVGFKGTPYGYYFLIIDPDNGAMKAD
ncbi:SH3 domain-containing protein [Pseudobacillus sp. FSL P4-0506]|uniref:SH3 domain-containing protein n=1 Tax=unclassified Pseudobacillus TaxID=2619284 RepID=UPI0030F6D809